MLVDGAESMSEVVFRNVAAEDDTGDPGEVIVQPGPNAGVDNLLSEVVRHVEVPNSVQVPGWPGRVEPVEIQAELVRAEESTEHLGHRRRYHAVRAGVFRVVGRGQERPPSGLLDRRQVVI